MLKQSGGKQNITLQIDRLRKRTGDRCGKLGNTDVCNLPPGGCKNQVKASAEPNSFTLCRWAHKLPLK